MSNTVKVPLGSREHEHNEGQARDIARKGSVPKRSDTPPAIHSGMRSQTRSGAVAFGGDHKSALDALSGLSVVPDKSGRVAAEHPLSKPPVANDHQRPLEFSPGMRSRTSGHSGADVLSSEAPGVAHNRAQARKDAYRDYSHDLGWRVLDEALSVAGADHPENMRRAVAAQQTIGRGTK